MSDESFLSRWSRRKAAERRGESEPEAAPPAEAVPAPVSAEPAADAPPPPTLEDAAKLTPDDDFAPFVARGVDEAVKRAALKKLFADPHFNAMDGLDTYIDDYSQPDPIPPAMLRELRQAAELRLFEPLDEDAVSPAGIEPVSEAAPVVTGETPAEPAEPTEPPAPDDPAQATPHGGDKPSSVE